MTIPCPSSPLSLQLKAAFANEIKALTDMRVRFVLDLHPEYAPQAASVAAAIREYIGQRLLEDRYVGYIGRIGDELVCAAGLLLYDLPPWNLDRPRRVGHVLNFYTDPRFRRRGCGRMLIGFIAADARTRRVTRLALNATTQGEPLYRAAGFHEQDEVHLIKEIGR